MASSDLAERCRLDTLFLPDCIQHTRYGSSRLSGRRGRHERWRPIRELGRGGFGRVLLEKEDRNERLRAVKMIVKAAMPRGFDYRQEVVTMALLTKYPHVFVDFYGWFEDSSHLYLAMEFFEHGDLGAYIRQQGVLAEDTAKIVTMQILEGLEIMHRHEFTHRDLKPQNIFVMETDPMWIKLGDFGVSKRVQDGSTGLKTQVFSFNYGAPELINMRIGSESNNYTPAVDTWSLGCVVHEILTGAPPFLNPYSLFEYTSGKNGFPKSHLQQRSVSSDGIVFLEMLLKVEAHERMSIEMALKHGWLADAINSVELDDLQDQLRNTRMDSQNSESSHGVGPNKIYQDANAGYSPYSTTLSSNSSWLDRSRHGSSDSTGESWPERSVSSPVTSPEACSPDGRKGSYFSANIDVSDNAIPPSADREPNLVRKYSNPPYPADEIKGPPYPTTSIIGMPVYPFDIDDTSRSQYPTATGWNGTSYSSPPGACSTNNTNYIVPPPPPPPRPPSHLTEIHGQQIGSDGTRASVHGSPGFQEDHSKSQRKELGDDFSTTTAWDKPFENNTTPTLNRPDFHRPAPWPPRPTAETVYLTEDEYMKPVELDPEPIHRTVPNPSHPGSEKRMSASQEPLLETIYTPQNEHPLGSEEIKDPLAQSSTTDSRRRPPPPVRVETIYTVEDGYPVKNSSEPEAMQASQSGQSAFWMDDEAVQNNAENHSAKSDVNINADASEEHGNARSGDRKHDFGTLPPQQPPVTDRRYIFQDYWGIVGGPGTEGEVLPEVPWYSDPYGSYIPYVQSSSTADDSQELKPEPEIERKQSAGYSMTSDSLFESKFRPCPPRPPSPPESAPERSPSPTSVPQTERKPSAGYSMKAEDLFDSKYRASTPNPSGTTAPDPPISDRYPQTETEMPNEPRPPPPRGAETHQHPDEIFPNTVISANDVGKGTWEAIFGVVLRFNIAFRDQISEDQDMLHSLEESHQLVYHALANRIMGVSLNIDVTEPTETPAPISAERVIQNLNFCASMPYRWSVVNFIHMIVIFVNRRATGVLSHAEIVLALRIIAHLQQWSRNPGAGLPYNLVNTPPPLLPAIGGIRGQLPALEISRIRKYLYTGYQRGYCNAEHAKAGIIVAALNHYNKHHEHYGKKLYNVEWKAEDITWMTMAWIDFVLEMDHFALAQATTTEAAIEKFWAQLEGWDNLTAEGRDYFTSDEVKDFWRKCPVTCMGLDAAVARDPNKVLTKDGFRQWVEQKWAGQTPVHPSMVTDKLIKEHAGPCVIQ